MEDREQNQGSPDAAQDRLRGHSFDGIEEYDNPMPGWWSWLFIATIVWSVVYVLGIQVFGFVDSYEDDLTASQAELQAIRAAYEAENPSVNFDEGAIDAFVGVAEHIEAGSAIFVTYCMVCHGDKGQGLIGPNLTDNYWIHGNTNEDLFRVITNGSVEKGMAAWSGVLTPEARAQTIAFIRSLEGTNPPGAKAPEGEAY